MNLLAIISLLIFPRIGYECLPQLEVKYQSLCMSFGAIVELAENPTGPGYVYKVIDMPDQLETAVVDWSVSLECMKRLEEAGVGVGDLLLMSWENGSWRKLTHPGRENSKKDIDLGDN